MALAETASLIVDLSLKGNFSKNLGKINRDLRGFDANLSRTEGRAFRAGQQIGTGIKNAFRLAAVGVGLLASQVAFGVRSLVELEQAQKQTEAVIKSTGGVARVSAGGVRRLAEEFESLNALIGDEVIQSAENMLLTFRNIRGKAFKPTLQAVLDLNTALGRGPEGLVNTALQVGKAMQDPEKGLTALRRAGVSFDKTQTKRIKQLVKEGKLYQAQQLILKELNREFGGSFKKQGESTAAAAAKFGDAIEDAQRTLAAGFLPVVRKVADALTTLFKDPAVVRGINDLGTGIAGLFTDKNIASGIGLLKDGFDAIKDAAPGIIEGAKIAGSIVSTAVSLFKSLPPEIQRLAIGAAAINKLTGGLITNLAGGILDKIFTRGGPLNPMYVVPVGAGLGGAPSVVPTGGKLSGALKVLAGVAVVGLVAEIAQLIHEQIKAPPDIPASQLSWPWGPKNTPTLLPEIFGGNGALGGTGSGGPGPQRPGGPTSGLSAPRRGPDHVTPILRDIARNTRRTSEVLHPGLHNLPGVQRIGHSLPPGHDTHGNNRPGLPPGHDLGGITAAAINNQTAVMKGWAQIEDRRVAKITEVGQAVHDEGAKTSTSVLNVRDQVSTSGASLVAATAIQTGAIVGAIWAARPIVNVTNVTRTTTIQNRYGPSNGSFGQNNLHGEP